METEAGKSGLLLSAGLLPAALSPTLSCFRAYWSNWSHWSYRPCRSRFPYCDRAYRAPGPHRPCRSCFPGAHWTPGCTRRGWSYRTSGDPGAGRSHRGGLFRKDDRL
nr:hypothetical protein [uncultured Flavonifractor sp.]